MEDTTVKDLEKPNLKRPIFIEGFPGLGEVGKIAVRFLIKHLGAKKMAELYSPHFPHHVLVDVEGTARLLNAQFFYWINKVGENDLILLTGDSQAQTIEGQYELTDKILDFISKYKTKLTVTLGGYRGASEDLPDVISVGTDMELTKLAYEAGAKPSPEGNPIVGIAGLMIGLAKFRGIDAICLLAKTRGYVPDPEAAKKILIVLRKILNLELDLNDLKEEIKRARDITEKMKRIEDRRERFMKDLMKGVKRRTTYIS